MCEDTVSHCHTVVSLVAGQVFRAAQRRECCGKIKIRLRINRYIELIAYRPPGRENTTLLLPANRSLDDTSFQVKGFSPPIEASRTRHLNTTLGIESPSFRGVVCDILLDATFFSNDNCVMFWNFVR